MSKSDYEIIIVGAGPAGVSTWLYLYKMDPELAKRTLVIDKAVFPRSKLCGGGISEWGIEMLGDLEIDLTIPTVKITTSNYILGEKSYTSHSSIIKNIVNRTEFDDLLVRNGLHRQMKLHQNENFQSIVCNLDSLTIVTSRQKYTARLLVGADGALSKVRRLMNLDNKVNCSRTLEVFAPVQNDYDHEYNHQSVTFDFSYLQEGVQGYVWHFPCKIEGQAMMNHGIFDSRIKRDYPHAKLKDLFTRVLQNRKVSMKPENWKGGPISHYNPDQPIAGKNILLVGDAAGSDPFMGGGIHLAIGYGKVAATEIVSAFNDSNISVESYNKRIADEKVGMELRDLNYIAKHVYKGDMQYLDFMFSRSM